MAPAAVSLFDALERRKMADLLSGEFIQSTPAAATPASHHTLSRCIRAQMACRPLPAASPDHHGRHILRAAALLHLTRLRARGSIEHIFAFVGAYRVLGPVRGHTVVGRTLRFASHARNPRMSACGGM